MTSMSVLLLVFFFCLSSVIFVSLSCDQLDEINAFLAVISLVKVKKDVPVGFWARFTALDHVIDGNTIHYINQDSSILQLYAFAKCLNDAKAAP